MDEIFFFFFFFFFFSVGKVVRYNTALARFGDNPAMCQWFLCYKWFCVSMVSMCQVSRVVCVTSGSMCQWFLLQVVLYVNGFYVVVAIGSHFSILAVYS